MLLEIYSPKLPNTRAFPELLKDRFSRKGGIEDLCPPIVPPTGVALLFVRGEDSFPFAIFVCVCYQRRLK